MEGMRPETTAVIRTHKLATLEKSMIESVIGRIEASLADKIKTIFASLPE
jgi:hypothetical protein